MEEDITPYSSEELSAYLISYENRGADPSTMAECARITQENGLSRGEVFVPADPDAFAAAEFDNRHFHYVVQDGRMFHRRQFNDGTWEDAVKMALGRE